MTLSQSHITGVSTCFHSPTTAPLARRAAGEAYLAVGAQGDYEAIRWQIPWMMEDPSLYGLYMDYI